MRTVRTPEKASEREQLRAPFIRRGSMTFEPDRHYVKVQLPDVKWDEDTVGDFLATIDPVTDQEAYRMDVDGRKAEDRKITGKGNVAILSCSKEFYEREQRRIVQESHDRMSNLPPLYSEHEYDASKDMTQPLPITITEQALQARG